MTTDAIVNMAQQAGYPHVGLRWNDQELSFLERFGALAVAADRAMRAAQPEGAQPAPQREAQEPVAVVVPCYTPSGKRVALYSAKQDLPIGTQLYTAPQPSPAAQGDALDAARYRWLREGNDAKHGAAWHVAVNLYGCEWDAAIDDARKEMS